MQSVRSKRDGKETLAFGVEPADATRVPASIGLQASERFLRARPRRSADGGRRMNGTGEIERGSDGRAKTANARVQVIAFRESARRRLVGRYEIA